MKRTNQYFFASAIYKECDVSLNTQTHILTVDGSSSEGLTLTQVVEQYKDVFEGEGMLEDELHLHVDYNGTPVRMPLPRPPIALKGAVSPYLAT